jgi:hypothetical protein
MLKIAIAGSLCLTTLLPDACSIAPMSRAFLKAPADTPVEQVFGCAEQWLAPLQGNRPNFWKHAITTRDVANGLFETGNFPNDNVMGFRIHLHYQLKTGAIDLRLKGTGLYFTDLGVDRAMSGFKEDLQKCLISLQK